MRTLGTIAVISALALTGCEKDKGGMSSKQSGTMRQRESTLLEHLPGGNVALFGGNYMRLQDYFQRGPFAKLMGQMEALVPGMKAWTECFIERDASRLEMLGAVSFRNDAVTMAYVMRGFGIADVERCAQRAGFPAKLDADGKYVAVQMPNPLGEIDGGYLVLDDGTLITRQGMPFPPGAATITGTTRADLEQMVAEARRSSAAGDEVLIAESRLIDRDRAIWFVADLTPTPLGKQVGRVRASMDIKGGLSVDVTVQVRDQDASDKVAKAIPELKQQLGMIERQVSKDVADVLRGLQFERKGDRLRFAVKVSDAQLEAMMANLPFGAMGGGGFGR
jgi:hypothetical protein